MQARTWISVVNRGCSNSLLEGMEERAKGIILLLMGLPGSGKSTLARSLGSLLTDCRLIHVCFDDILRDREHWGEAGYSWKSSRSTLTSAIRSWLEGSAIAAPGEVEERTLASLGSSDSPFILLLDDNLYYRSMRYPFHQLAVDFGLAFGILDLDTPLPLAIQRDEGREERIGPEIITAMAAKLQPPSLPWEQPCLRLESGEPAAVLPFLEKLWTMPLRNAELRRQREEERARDQSVTRESRIHQVDLMLREEVGAVMRDLAPGLNSKTGAILSQLKSDILSKLRSGLYDPHSLTREDLAALIRSPE